MKGVFLYKGLIHRTAMAGAVSPDGMWISPDKARKSPDEVVFSPDRKVLVPPGAVLPDKA